MQLMPSSAGRYPGRQRRTAHSPDRQTTSATPGSAEQSLPMGEWAVNGSTQPPQLSRSRAVLTHSHAREPPPRTPQAAHPGPISVQDPLPAQLLFLLTTCPEGHNPAATHLPLQMTDGALHAHVVGLLAGECENPSVHLNAQTLSLVQRGTLWSG